MCDGLAHVVLLRLLTGPLLFGKTHVALPAVVLGSFAEVVEQHAAAAGVVVGHIVDDVADVLLVIALAVVVHLCREVQALGLDARLTERDGGLVVVRDVVDDALTGQRLEHLVDEFGRKARQVRKVHLVNQHKAGEDAGVGAEHSLHEPLHLFAALVEAVQLFLRYDELHLRLLVVVRPVFDVSGVVEQSERTVGLDGKLTEGGTELFDAEEVGATCSLVDANLVEKADVLVGLADVVGRRVVLDHTVTERGDVVGVVEEDCVGSPSVAPSTSRLLEVGFDGVGHTVVDDQPYVGLVDAHAEGVGRNHHAAAALCPVRLTQVALGIGQTGVVVLSRQTLAFEVLAQFRRQLPVADIHDGAALRNALEDVDNLRLLVHRFADDVNEVLTLETHGAYILLLEFQALLNVVHNARRSRSRQGEQGNRVGNEVAQSGDLQIGRTKIISPLAHAVGFIDANHAQVAHVLEFGAEEVALQSLGRDVEELIVAEDAVVQHAENVVVHHAGVHRVGLDAACLQLAHLVLHQGDERRDHKAKPFLCQRRHLKTQRLAPSRGHQAEGVASLAYALDDVLLNAAKGFVAEDFVEDGKILIHGVGCPRFATALRRACGCSPRRYRQCRRRAWS